MGALPHPWGVFSLIDCSYCIFFSYIKMKHLVQHVAIASNLHEASCEDRVFVRFVAALQVVECCHEVPPASFLLQGEKWRET